MSTQTENGSKADSLSPEQANFLASIETVEKTLAPEPQAAPGAAVGGVPAVVEDPVQELSEALQLLVDTLAELLPFLPQIYNPKVIGAHARAANAVAVKYGWDLKTKMGPEAALLFVAVPPAVSAFMLGRQYIAAVRKAHEEGQSKAGTDGNS